jgi:hypothetical protein
MISSDNLALNNFTNDEDFTYSNYRQLLKMAKSGWKILDYNNIDWDEKFIVWRHDVDYSLNYSLKLAKIEQKEGVKSTYFINPHSEFYNIAELSQYRIIKEILSFGHDIGLHFDSAFYELKSEAELNITLAKESSYIEDLLGVKPTAFSFHNPVSENLECEAYEYGGLTNCYSLRFKEEVGYCSDSNGYWRFRRLHEVLKQQKEPRLQVLTHPSWWQEKPYPPRQKIFRASYGRAFKIMKFYDAGLVGYMRTNFAGASKVIDIFRDKRPDDFELCDYLWNKGNFKTLFLKIWRLHEAQIQTLCELYFEKVWRVSKNEIKQLINNKKVTVDGSILFNTLLQNEWENVLGQLAGDYKMWKKNRNLLVIEKCSLSKCELEKGCLYLCSVISKFAEWGLRQKFKSDGLDVHETEKLEAMTFSESNVQVSSEYTDDWFSFKERLESITN